MTIKTGYKPLPIVTDPRPPATPSFPKICINGHDNCPLCKRNQHVESLLAQFKAATDTEVKVRILETMSLVAADGHAEVLDMLVQPHFEVKL